ncbi:heme-binding domain-containing protein [Elizabethkingia miricola]|uniref:heme-binding domain-containing protein n=1 Tax=Elizabethkingia miricola TaxID=172045 RepID=UPI00099A17FE|nr:heme-binding domain-containing protein [Elizabethkingia miricola]OPC32560.1 cytochrome C [Elizabethkingia miricola]
MKKFLVILLVAFIIIQFFPIDKVNPPVNERMDFLTIKKTPEEVSKVIRNSCYDCHSNETKYPWYSNIAPVSWWMKDHIIDGRKHLNFSTFALYDTERQLRKLDESVEMIEKDKMPLETYLLAHQNARLSDTDKKMLIKYLKNARIDTEIRYNTTEQEQP